MIIDAILVALLGATTWTFLEYALHNWNGHLMKGKTTFSKLHLQHHADPSFFAPTLTKVAMAAPVLGITGLVTGFLFGWLGVVYTASLAVAYFGYEVLHRRVHTHPPLNRYGRWARKHHLAHHFTNPRENHGVSTDLWDRVFRTRTPIAQVRVPRRLAKRATTWLLDGDEIAAPYRDDYELAGRAPRAAREAPAAQPEPPVADLEAAYAGLAPT